MKRRWCLLAVVGLLLWVRAAAAESLLIGQAQFQAFADGTWQTVALPHDWPALAQGRPLRHARYRIDFEVGADALADGKPWALSIHRISTRYRLSVDGRLVAVGEEGHADRSPQHVHALTVDIAAPLLHAGTNTLTLDIEAEQGRGLAPLRIGPRDEILADAQRYEAWHLTLPQLVNAATLPFALALIGLWVVRRQEQALGLFALAWLPAALRNYGVYLAAAPWGSSMARASVVFGRVGSAILFTLFALTISRRPLPRLRQLCWASLGLLLAVVVAGVISGRLAAWRSVIYPIGLPFAAASVYILLQRLREEAAHFAVSIALGAAAFLVAGVHDEAMVLGRLGIEAEEWLPWVSPLIFISVSFGLLVRAARALDQVETLNLQLEQRVAARTGELTAANAAKTRFMASASHDLRQPLQSISLLVALLSRRAESPQVAEIAERLDTSISGMRSMLDAVLDVSSLDAGTEAPKFEPIAVEALLERIVHEQRPGAEARGLELRLRPSRLWVRSDSNLLVRILGNLVSNAIRYTRSGGVLVAARQRGDEVVIEIWDTGVGIASEHHESIFDEFVQLDNPERNRLKGVGLGLAIVRRISTLIGARVTMASRPGRGSVFRLWLPRLPVDLSLPGMTAARPLDRTGTGGLFIVVVDDDEAIRFGMTALLSELGCRVATAASGREALIELERHLRTPDAALVDYRLGRESGHDVIAALREAVDEQLPVALMSGDLVIPDYPGSAAPPPFVMRKPVDLEQLCDWLATIKARTQASGADAAGA